ncbi:MAG TPA: tautomerase family protein [Mesorhizobium sp.]|uniref:tautomerase family protein n=1 Tax=Mesorhizobium sp. TaxID=1871066 RepID=UPI002DDD8363|nr:tautomerase family protein [Mesorhizobium sp.]HEV2505097.1 tautomerase family protein [Mesorhizobium sp.]
MPLIDIVHASGSLTSEQQQRISERITAAAITAEGLPDNVRSRAIAVVAWHAADSIFVGGKPADHRRFDVRVRAFAEALTDQRRTQLVEQVTQAFRDEGGDGRTVWCTFYPLQPGTFGAGGSLVSYDQVKAMMRD